MKTETETEKPIIRYEDNAESVTITYADGATAKGWACKTCHVFHGIGEGGEHMARWCHATDCPCECGGRRERRYSICDTCRAKKDDERWFSKLAKAIEWDGTTPLALDDDGEKFFFDVSDVADYIADHDDPESIRFVLCRPETGPTFEMIEFLGDSLPDDDHGGHSLVTEGIDKIVNDWIAANSPFSWWATDKVVTLASVRKACGMDEKGEA